MFFGRRHARLGNARDEIDAEQPGGCAGEKQRRVAIKFLRGEVLLEPFHIKTGREIERDAECGHQCHALREKSAEALLRSQIAHPGIPTAARDRAEEGIEQQAQRERSDCRHAGKEKRDRGSQQQNGSAEAGGEHADNAASAILLHQIDRGHLHQLREEGNRGEHTDEQVRSAEQQREVHEKSAAGEREHGLRAQAVFQNALQSGLDFLLG